VITPDDKQLAAEPAKHFDAGKARVDLLPPEAMIEVARVLQFGGQKYGDRNWMGGMSWSRLYGSTLRHLFRWWMGEDDDDESGISHLAHAACCIFFLLYYRQHKPQLDDRPGA
jgi:hypothetical protein